MTEYEVLFMPIPRHSNAEADQYFRELKEQQEEIQAVYYHITDTITSALQKEDHPLLLSLISYIESQEGQSSYRFSGKPHRILRYLHIIELEYKYHCVLFCNGCQDADSIYDKYVSSLLAMRRILFQLSPESVAEAYDFLRANALSPFAIYTIANNDLIRPTADFYRQISDLYRDIWNETESQMFATFTASGGME